MVSFHEGIVYVDDQRMTTLPKFTIDVRVNKGINEWIVKYL